MIIWLYIIGIEQLSGHQWSDQPHLFFSLNTKPNLHFWFQIMIDHSDFGDPPFTGYAAQEVSHTVNGFGRWTILRLHPAQQGPAVHNVPRQGLGVGRRSSCRVQVISWNCGHLSIAIRYITCEKMCPSFFWMVGSGVERATVVFFLSYHAYACMDRWIDRYDSYV